MESNNYSGTATTPNTGESITSNNVSDIHTPPAHTNDVKISNAKKSKSYFLLADEAIEFTEGETPKLSFYFNNIGNKLCQLAKESDKPCTIGLYGDWGSGKTTLMNYMISQLKAENNFTVMFQPWKYDSKEDITLQFIKTLYEKLLMSVQFKWLRKNKRKIKKLFKLLFTVPVKHIMKINPVSNIGYKIFTEIYNKMKHTKQSIEERETVYDEIKSAYRKIIQEIIDYHNSNNEIETQRIYIFIDDLDRCYPKTVIEFFDKIKLFFNTKNVVYIIGLYPEIINHKIKSEYKK